MNSTSIAKGDFDEGVEVAHNVATLHTDAGEDLECATGDGSEGATLENTSHHDHSSHEIKTRANSDDADKVQKTPKPERPWHKHPRITELYQKADWWTLYISLLSFDLAVVLVFCIPLDATNDMVKYLIPQPKSWTTNPLDAWDAYNLIGVPILLLAFFAMYLVALKFMGSLILKEQPDSEGNTTTIPNGRLGVYTGGFAVMAVLATLAMWLGRNEWCSDNGIGYAVWAIVLGMIPTNLLPADKTAWIRTFAAKDGEFFIKCSLGLLAVELTVLARVGGPAMIVTWIGSPLAIAIGFALGIRLFHCPDNLAMLIAVGASWCGASAISAVAPVVLASSEDVALAISVVAFFTVIFTFVQPYVAMAVGMPDDVAGAWIGGSVDQTGNVIVSAAIISEEATEVAGIVKMVLNAGMGVMASVIACYWSMFRVRDADGAAPKFSFIMMWDKFPKFTLGFVITSIALTIIVEETEGTLEAEALPRAVASLNKWWFAIAFCGIGLTTDIMKLFREAWKSGVIQVYLLANTVDIFLALGLSYLAYGLME
jgi:uncharacterized membrane protein YadS